MLDLEFEVTPKTKIVYLVRDPRAVFSSLLRFYNDLIQQQSDEPDHMVKSMELAEDFLGIGSLLLFLPKHVYCHDNAVMTCGTRSTNNEQITRELALLSEHGWLPSLQKHRTYGRHMFKIGISSE